jgi:hypothetical protein
MARTHQNLPVHAPERRREGFEGRIKPQTVLPSVETMAGRLRASHRQKQQ